LGSYGIKTLIPEDQMTVFTLPEIRYFVSQGSIVIDQTKFKISQCLYIGASHNLVGENGIQILSENGNIISNEEALKLQTAIMNFGRYRQSISLPGLEEIEKLFVLKVVIFIRFIANI
jgi:hypothetical protein